MAVFIEPEDEVEAELNAQRAQAMRDREVCVRVREALRAEAVLTAEKQWDEVSEDNVEELVEMLDGTPHEAVRLLKRTAAGCRELIRRWERLEALLEQEGTWYGGDRHEAV